MSDEEQFDFWNEEKKAIQREQDIAFEASILGMCLDNPQIGDEVYDDLTGELHTILEILIPKTPQEGLCVGYIIDSLWLGGGRYGWEISKPTRHPDYNSEVPDNIILSNN